jgi:cytochrome b
MIKMFTMWLILSAAVGFGIMAVRQMSGKEQWQLTKLVAYATICSLVAVVLLAGLVVIF